MIRIAVAEDDPRCTQQLRQYISDFGRANGRAFQVTCYNNGEDLIERYRPQFDIILLDVEMPFIDGITAANYIRQVDQSVIIIFVTNLAQYAIQGYTVRALDYILKPLNYTAFSQRLERALLYIRRREERYLTVPVKGGAVKLETGHIYFIEYQRRQLVFHTRTGTCVSLATLQQIEETLEGEGFFRCNKGCLVNLALVDGVQDGCVLICGERLPISRTRKQAFLTALNQYMGEAIY